MCPEQNQTRSVLVCGTELNQPSRTGQGLQKGFGPSLRGLDEWLSPGTLAARSCNSVVSDTSFYGFSTSVLPTWDKAVSPFCSFSSPTTITALGKRTKGNLWFHRSGVEYLFFVMNPTLMPLIKAISAIHHMSLVSRGSRS